VDRARSLVRRESKDAGKAQGVDQGLRFVLTVFVASRLFYLVAGAELVRMVPTAPYQRATSDMPSGTLNLWAHWDGEHYAKLALEGYSTRRARCRRRSSPSTRS